jgi:hypothetical protein
VEKYAEHARLPELLTDPSFEDLAACQGVQPISDFDALLGQTSPDDDSADEFSKMLREWRTEAPASRQ